MSEVEEALAKTLRDDATVAGLVGTRIFPGPASDPDQTRPYISYQRVDGPRLRALDGAQLVAHPRFQLNVWADTPESAWAVGTAVRQALDDFTGTVLGVAIIDTAIEDDTDIYEDSPQDRTRRAYGRRLDYTIWVRET